jgi:hypothetical protein
VDGDTAVRKVEAINGIVAKKVMTPLVDQTEFLQVMLHPKLAIIA